MAIIKGSFFSTELDKIVQYTSIFPDKHFKNISVLLLFHGRSGNNNSWLEQTTIANLVRNLPLVILCPDADISYYQNMKYGKNYKNFFNTEFLQKIKLFHHIDIYKLYVAGNSMGGYGALQFALTSGLQITRIGLFSPLLNPDSLVPIIQNIKPELFSVFGETSFENSDNNLLNFLSIQNDNLPFTFHSCGQKDFLLQDSLQLNKILQNKTDYTFISNPNNSHDWNSWSEDIKPFIQLIESDLIE